VTSAGHPGRQQVQDRQVISMEMPTYVVTCVIAAGASNRSPQPVQL